MEQKNKEDFLNDENEQKRVKVTLNQMKKSINNKKDETIELRKNENGVRYIVFTFKTDLKKYKKEKWILTPTKEIVIFLKSVISKKKNKQSNKVIFNNRNNNDKNNNNSNSKNKASIQKIYKAKRNYVNLYSNKTIKESNKNQNDYEYENNEKSDDDNRNIITTKNINQKIFKKDDYLNDNSSKVLFSDYSFAKGVNKKNKRNKDINIEDNYATKIAKSTLNLKTVEDNFYNHYRNNQKILNTVDRHHSPSQFDYESNDFRNKENLYYIIKKKKFISRQNKPNYTVKEKEPKNIHKIKYKKAKIRKFVPNKNIYEPETPERRGNLYDYYKNSNSTGNISCIFRKDHNKKKKKKKTKKENHFEYNNNNAESSDSEDNEKNIIRNKIFSSNKKMKVNRNRNKKNMQTNPINSCSVTNINGTRSNIINKTHKKINSLESNNSKLLKTAVLGGTYKNPLYKTKPKIIHNNNSMPNINENNFKIKFKTHNEMSEIDDIKSRFKQRLIEINDNLLDAIHYYNGPIDISCISCKNYVDTVEDLKNKFAKKGYKSLKSENNYLKFTNGINIYLIEIVIIRNNMLYYLVHKN